MIVKALKLLLILSFVLQGCIFYTFKDISINPDVKTFYVDYFQNNAFNAPASINVQFADELRNKIRKETGLTQDNNEPDIQFSGSIESYNVTSKAPTKDGSYLNQLEISIRVKYVNIKSPKENYEKSYRYSADFRQDQSLQDVQITLIKDIFDYILDEIINNSFNNW